MSLTVPAHVEVHVGRIAPDGADLDPWLIDEDRRRAARILSPTARARFLAARALLRRLVPAVRHDDTGRPVTDGGPFVSVSHSGDLVVVALSVDVAVGVDVERLRPVRQAAGIARRLLPPAERDAVLAAPVSQRDETFLRAWTRLEADGKARGLGILAARDPAGEDAPAVVIDLDPAPGYVGALAGAAEDLRVRLVAS